MSFFLDIILIAICLAVVIISAKKGFVRSLMGLVSKIVALIVAYTFTPAVASYIKGKFIFPKISDGIFTAIRQQLMGSGEADLSGLAEKIPNVLSRYGVSGDAIEESVAKSGATGEQAVRAVADQIADPVASMISTALAFIGLFIVACLVLWIVTAIINAVFKLPVLKTANTVFGLIFGIVSAVIIMFVYSSLVSMLVRSLGSVSTEWFGDGVIDRTLLVKFFAEHDIFSIASRLGEVLRK